MSGREQMMFYNLCQNIIRLVMLVIAVFVAAVNLLYTSSVAYVWTEDVSIARTSWVSFAAAAALLAVFFAFWKLSGRLKETHVFLFFTVLYLAVGLYWVLHVGTELRMDADSAHRAAVALHNHDFSFLAPGEDLYKNQHQLGLVTYEYLLGFISTDIRFQYFVKLLEIIGINFASWRLANLCFGGSHGTNLFTILFSFLFLPQFFFLAFGYGLIPGLFFMLLSFLFLYKYFAGHGKRYLVFCFIFLVFAVGVKGNNIIGAIAIAILLFLRSLKERRVRYLPIALAALLCAGSVSSVTGAVYERVSGMELCGGKPMILWIAMGTEPYYENAAGWYNGYCDWAFEEAGRDPQKASELALGTLKDTAYTFRDHPDWMLSFFGEKLVSMWCDPLYESVWSGPLPDAGAEHKSEFLNELYSGRGIEPGTAVFMKGFMIVMFLLAALFALRRRNRDLDYGYICLYFIGGFLLHILWEAKSQYVYPYVFVLLPCCAHEMNMLANRIGSVYNKKFRTGENGEGDSSKNR